MDRKYFQITYDFDKLNDSEKQAVFAEATKVFDGSGKVIVSGWEGNVDIECGGWFRINNNDDLPKHSDFYLICRFNECTGGPEITISWFDTKTKKFLDCDFQDKVTHWRYMPELPEE